MTTTAQIIKRQQAKLRADLAERIYAISEPDDHGLIDCTCGHVGFAAETGPDGKCVNCAERYREDEARSVGLPANEEPISTQEEL